MATVYKTVRLRTELLVISIVITIITQFARFFFFLLKTFLLYIATVYCYPFCNVLYVMTYLGNLKMARTKATKSVSDS